MAKVDYGTSPPVPERLPDGRLRAVRRGTVLDFTARSQRPFLDDVILREGTTSLPGYPTLKLIRQDFNGPGATSSLSVVETFEELSPFDDYRDMAITFPGVRPSAFQVRDDFPFRTNPESQVVTVRIAHKFFITRDPRRIPLIPEFRPRSLSTGDAVSVLTDNTTVTNDEYLGMAAAGQEFVDRCLRERVNGQIWVRKTFYVRAQ